MWRTITLSEALISTKQEVLVLARKVLGAWTRIQGCEGQRGAYLMNSSYCPRTIIYLTKW